jgi:hypothetical protein
MVNKIEFIKFRIEKESKNKWKKFCLEKQISLSSLIIKSVENKILDDERRQILAFIEKQDNFFVKVETNINQVAKVANAQKFISSDELKIFNEKMNTVIDLKQKQNGIFQKIYSLIADDR